MELVVRAVVIYAIVLIVMRASGKRTLAEITAFDAVLLLIISEAASQALLAEDPSVTGAAISITALVLLDRLLDVLEWRFATLSKLGESVPPLLVADGQPLREHLKRSHVRLDEVLSQARLLHGLERLDQVKYDRPRSVRRHLRRPGRRSVQHSQHHSRPMRQADSIDVLASACAEVGRTHLRAGAVHPEAIDARCRLYRALTDRGWQPPGDAASLLAMDEMMERMHARALQPAPPTTALLPADARIESGE